VDSTRRGKVSHEVPLLQSQDYAYESACPMLCPRLSLSGEYPYPWPFDVSSKVKRRGLMDRCAVINRAVATTCPAQSESERSGEWQELYLPAGIVSPSEREQIISLLPTWTETLIVRPPLTWTRVVEANHFRAPISPFQPLKSPFVHSLYITPPPRHLLFPQNRDIRQSSVYPPRDGLGSLDSPRPRGCRTRFRPSLV
jgi:hypothetical protein